MQQASTHFNDEQRDAIQLAVAAAESSTSAEIVPVVATASGRYDRAEDIVGLWVAILALVCTWLWIDGAQQAEADWGATAGSWDLAWLVLAVVVGFLAGVVIGARVTWLRALFTPRAEMRDEVADRAQSLFCDQRIHHTTSGTGILIYISLFERMAAVIGDKTVTERLGQAALDEACATLTGQLARGDHAAALVDTIRTVGAKLAEVLPRTGDDENELADALVTIDT